MAMQEVLFDAGAVPARLDLRQFYSPAALDSILVSSP
jgi:hypothetical protein